MGVRDRIPRMRARFADVVEERARCERTRKVVECWNNELVACEGVSVRPTRMPTMKCREAVVSQSRKAERRAATNNTATYFSTFCPGASVYARPATGAPARVRFLPPTLEATMQTEADRPEAPTAIRNHLDAIFVSLFTETRAASGRPRRHLTACPL
jgi:hypothetical protein